jgi:hypothetical protein
MPEERRRRASRRRKEASKPKRSDYESGVQEEEAEEEYEDHDEEYEEEVEHEFSADHEQVIRSVALKMRTVGGAGLALCAIALVSAFFAGRAKSSDVAVIGQILAVATYAAVSVWTFNAGNAFQAIVDTRGSDLSHLMVALKAVDRVYFVHVIFLAIGALYFMLLLALGAGALT